MNSITSATSSYEYFGLTTCGANFAITSISRKFLTHPKVLLRPEPRLVVAVLPGHEQVFQAALETFIVF